MREIILCSDRINFAATVDLECFFAAQRIVPICSFKVTHSVENSNPHRLQLERCVFANAEPMLSLVSSKLSLESGKLSQLQFFFCSCKDKVVMAKLAVMAKGTSAGADRF